MSKFARRAAILAVLVAVCAVVALTTGVVTHSTASATAAGPCQLGNRDGQIKHVIYLQFDNTHYRRDRANVPSDLEQMPHLLNFLKGNGTLATNDHTILISHTAGGILASLTGLYPDRNGQTVSNSYDYFKSTGLPQFTSSFKYWTNTADGTNDTLPNMVGDGGQTTPAPWLTYTAAGCNVGGVSAANIELENNSTSPGGDIATVYGPSSPEAAESAQDRTTDFVGIAIHCAQGNAVCNTPNAKPDNSTTIPGSDNGYKGIFGAKYVNPAITGGQPCVKATDGSNITDANGKCGFPGFDGAFAKNTLGEVAQMQENGVPVTFAYISDAHDNHAATSSSDSFTSTARGPGEADYEAQLKAYDDAFAAFFQNLAAHGIDKSNTLFVVTVDEGDHFVGGQGTPDPANPGALVYTHANCVTLTACPSNQLGEVDDNLNAALPAGEPSFDIHFDDAPTFYVNGQPERTNAALRKLEQDVGAATLPDPYKGGAQTPITYRLADTVEENTLHMVNSDPKRTPSFTMFGNDDFYFQLSNPCTGVAECVSPSFAWNHGDDQDEIGNTWFGMVGPGVARNGIDSKTWSDHVDLRPTINALLGLQDSYTDDGRVVTQAIDERALPRGLSDERYASELGSSYKQINAPFGQFASDTLVASTAALKTSDALKYDSIETAIANLTTKRNVLAGQIRQALNDAASGARLDETQSSDWIRQAQSLLDQAHALAVANPAS